MGYFFIHVWIYLVDVEVSYQSGRGIHTKKREFIWLLLYKERHLDSCITGALCNFYAIGQI